MRLYIPKSKIFRCFFKVILLNFIYMKILLNTSGLTHGDMDFSGFEKLGEVVYVGETDREEFIALARDCGAIVVNKIIVDEQLLSACPQLKYVGVFATGYNYIDLEACTKRGITVCNVPDYSTHAVSQHVFALLLSLFGRISEYTRSVKDGDWIKSEAFCYFPWATREIYGKTFGVYGYGSIGRAAAKIAEALGMNVIVCTRTPPKDCPYRLVSKEEIFKESDVLSLHCPLTAATEKLINRQTLALMKPEAVLVNTARGGLVDENALAEALNGGALAGACLDTVAVEPMLADNPLRCAKNCLITPHVAWVSYETRTRLVKIAAENLKSFLSGKPQNVVNK